MKDMKVTLQGREWIQGLFLTCLEAVNSTLCAAGEAEALRVALAVVDVKHFSKWNMG